MKLALTNSKSSRERYYLINGSMGSYGEPANHANHKYKIANGIDKGNGYQGYISVSYFLSLEYIPASAKNKLIALLKSQNLIFSQPE